MQRQRDAQQRLQRAAAERARDLLVARRAPGPAPRGWRRAPAAGRGSRRRRSAVGSCSVERRSVVHRERRPATSATTIPGSAIRQVRGALDRTVEAAAVATRAIETGSASSVVSERGAEAALQRACAAPPTASEVDRAASSSRRAASSRRACRAARRAPARRAPPSRGEHRHLARPSRRAPGGRARAGSDRARSAPRPRERRARRRSSARQSSTSTEASIEAAAASKPSLYSAKIAVVNVWYRSIAKAPYSDEQVRRATSRHPPSSGRPGLRQRHAQERPPRSHAEASGRSPPAPGPGRAARRRPAGRRAGSSASVTIIAAPPKCPARRV